jgi:hypothetical protein
MKAYIIIIIDQSSDNDRGYMLITAKFVTVLAHHHLILTIHIYSSFVLFYHLYLTLSKYLPEFLIHL